MKNARNSIIATAALALLTWGAVPAMAATDAQAPATTASASAPAHHGHMKADKWQHRQTRRAERLKNKLQLTEAQQPAWDAYQKAMQPKKHARLDRGEMKNLTTPERIDRMRAQREQRAAEADQRGEAIKTFYAQLTAEQQKVFDAQSMRGRRDGHQGKRHHRKGGHGEEAAS